MNRMNFGREYLEELKRRARRSHVYKPYQLAGLQVAEILKDPGHKSLYIKLAKEKNPQVLIRLAKEIAEQKNIRNKGAYFMSCLGAPSPGESTPRKRRAVRVKSHA